MNQWIDTHGIDWCNQLILLVSFSSIYLIHQLKIWYFWSIVSTIDHKNLIWLVAINPLVRTQLIVLIQWSNLQFKIICWIFTIFAMATKNTKLLFIYLYKKMVPQDCQFMCWFAGSSLTLCKKGLPYFGLVPLIPKNYGKKCKNRWSAKKKA